MVVVGFVQQLHRFSKRCVVLEYSELRVGIDGALHMDRV